MKKDYHCNSVENILNKLNKYAEKGKKTLLTTSLALSIIANTLTPAKAIAQTSTNDTIYGTGWLVGIDDSTTINVPQTTIKIKPLQIEKTTPDTTYEITTNNDGIK